VGFNPGGDAVVVFLEDCYCLGGVEAAEQLDPEAGQPWQQQAELLTCHTVTSQCRPQLGGQRWEQQEGCSRGGCC